jgi:hypothetical protein
MTKFNYPLTVLIHEIVNRANILICEQIFLSLK